MPVNNGKPRRKKATSKKPLPKPKRIVPERITMDIADAAAYIGISRQLAYAEAKANRLPVVWIRGRVFVVKPLLDEMLMEKARKSWKR